MMFPCTCQFCKKRFLNGDLANCCEACWKLYKAGKLKKKPVQKAKKGVDK